MSVNNFGAVASSLTKFFHAMSYEAGMIIWVQILEVSPHPKFGAISDNFRI